MARSHRAIRAAQSSGRTVPSAATFAAAPEAAHGHQGLEFSPGQLARDPASRSELAARHRSTGAGEVQRDLLASGQLMPWLATLDVADGRARGFRRGVEREVLWPEPALILEDHRLLEHGLQLADVARPAAVS